VPEAPTLHTLPDGSQASFNPATGKWDVQFKKPAAAPTLDLGAPRPGQRTNLALVEQQYKLFAAQLAADPNLTPEEYNRRLQQYIATNVTPAVERATAEVNAAADAATARQREADARAARTEERQTTTAERTGTLAEAHYRYKGGQDAVSNALALLPYQANPLFAEEFARGLGVLSSGGGPVSFSPEAFRVPLPDLNALADQGAQRAAAMYQQSAGVPFTPRPVGGALPVSTTAAADLAGVPMALRGSWMPGAVGAPAPTPQVVPPVVPQQPPPPWDPFSAGGPGSSPLY
jgi:hypothetical protein